MPKLRLTFPFLWRDRIEGRAKRCVRDQPLPLLLSSVRAHLRCITALAYIDDLRLVLRCGRLVSCNSLRRFILICNFSFQRFFGLQRESVEAVRGVPADVG